jgi:hypothetical protein
MVLPIVDATAPTIMSVAVFKLLLNLNSTMIDHVGGANAGRIFNPRTVKKKRINAYSLVL